MTTIRTTCPDCGTVELTISQVTLEPGRYRFDCPQCDTTRLHPASARTVSILVTCGVPPVGPITEDEIGLFVMELDVQAVEL